MTNYGRGLYKQIEEQTLTIEKLTKENKKLRLENKELNKKIDAFMNNLDAKIAAAVEKATKPLNEEIERKNVEISKSTTEILRLKAIINKDSGNSSQPPSKNGFKKIVNSREKSNRATGGQKGHVGARLELPSNINELVEKGYAEERLIDHTDGSDEYVSRWTLDIDVKVIITEHRYLHGEKLPTELFNEVTYGDNIKALTVLLSNEGIIAEKRLAEFFKEVTHNILSPSDGTLDKFLSQFGNKLDSEISTIKNDLLNGNILHVDETPMRCTQRKIYEDRNYEDTDEEGILETAEKTSFSATIRTHSNEECTLYTVNGKKDMDGVDRDGILPNYMGMLSHDHDKKYYNYGKGHATCGSHLLRELKGLYELQNCPWAKEMQKFITEMNDHKNKDLALGKTACEAEVLKEYEIEYDILLSEGNAELLKLKENELGRKELNAMLNRLVSYKDCYLLFMRDYNAPFTNNLSERDLRPCKTKQKVSGCFRSLSGLEAYAKMRSFISTVKKRSKNVFKSILDVQKGVPVLY